MPNVAQHLVSAANVALKRVGLRLVPTWRLSRLSQVTYLTEVFRRWHITGVVDVGANQGQYAGFLREQIGFGGPIVSVEPVPALAKLLEARARMERNWRVTECALGPSTGRASLNVTANTEFSSLLEPGAKAREFFANPSEVRQTIEVDVSTLDRVIEDHRGFLGERIYLKLDTQGYDLHVLSGLVHQEPQVVAAQSEVAITSLYEGGPTITDSFDAFTARGFTVSQFFPNNEGHFPRLHEFDCHFVKLDREVSSRVG
jgi:FkbM family methyltransferase